MGLLSNIVKSVASATGNKSSGSKTIDDYKKDYEAARVSGNAAGMAAANKAANALRTQQGVAQEFATQDIKNVATGAVKPTAPTVTAPAVVQSVPTPQQAYVDPTLMGQKLGDSYGLTYNYNDILGILNKATEASYGVQKQEYKQTEDQFYRNLISTQSASLDTLKQGQAAAVATGASKGIAAANELSSILNLQNLSAEGATTLAQDRNLLADKEQAEYSKNGSTALDTSNAVKQAIAGIDMTKYGYDIQQLIGKLDYLAAMDTNAKSLEGVKYNADANLAGTQAAASKSYSSNAYPRGSAAAKIFSAGNTAQAATGAGGELKADGMVFNKNPDGTYNIRYRDADGMDKTLPNVSAEDAIRVQNNGDVGAAQSNYKEGEFVNAVNAAVNKGSPIPTGVYTSAQMLAFANKDDYNWHYSNDKKGYTATAKKGTTATTDLSSLFKDGVKTGTTVSITGRGELKRDGTLNYTYNAGTGMWSNGKGNTFSQKSMVDLIKSRSDGTKYSITVK